MGTTAAPVPPATAGPQFHVGMSARASDTTFDESGTVNVDVPAGLSERAFNDALLDALVAWAEGFHGWTVHRRDVFFQSVERG